ncbi:hypothetical protein P7L78_16215 [Tistrella bauzanensis]|uniref:hypothetical protein n=1 Tax=Tistrella TaxID=171436 RepID=UPI0031F5F681
MSWGGMLACMVLVGLVFAAGYRITDMRYARAVDTSGWTAGAQAPADRFIARADWRSYGGTHANDRFSALDQITPDNVARLEKAWSFSIGDMPKPGEKRRGREFSFEATPIKAGNSLYLCTPHRDVIALDATTGDETSGDGGMVDLRQNMGPVPPGFHFITAPPLVMNGRIVLSGWVYDKTPD